jgi:hypothetical protein
MRISNPATRFGPILSRGRNPKLRRLKRFHELPLSVVYFESAFGPNVVTKGSLQTSCCH